VQRLVATQVQRFVDVPADPSFSVRLLEDVTASEFDLVMVATGRGLHRKAVSLAYDGARKGVDAVMLAMGLRIGKGEGAHAAVVTFAKAEFVETAAEQRDAPGHRRCAPPFFAKLTHR
jgi:ribose 5-phosphate isomerase RpiB